MGFLLAYATSLAAFMPYILSDIKVILRNRNYEIEYLVKPGMTKEGNYDFRREHQNCNHFRRVVGSPRKYPPGKGQE